MNVLDKGQKAPGFSLPRDGGGTLSLTDFDGRPVVIFFYPKDNTTGCTKEATEFSANLEAFTAKGVAVIGISPDSAKSHDKFVAKHGLTVALGADESHEVLEAYGVWKEKSMYGRTYMGVERTTILLDRNHAIAEIWHKVKVPGHVQAVLDALDTL
ncbi:peroxiredoxin [Rhizobium halophytocola]|nr:peroxiredoxin [Rhizobium halophytocola]